MGIMAKTEKWLVNNAMREWVRRCFEAPVLLAELHPPPGGTLLEVGSGRAGLTLLLAQRFPGVRIVALEYDPELVDKARQLLERKPRWALQAHVEQIELRRGDATQLPFPDETFDGVLACLVLHHIAHWEAAVREIGRVLKPGGDFVVEELLRRFFAFWGPVTRLFPPEALIEEHALYQHLQSAGFDVVSYRRLFRGAACVVTARKVRSEPSKPREPAQSLERGGSDHHSGMEGG